jgi:uncharacterized repeat protein (TIGR03803 family)
MYSNRQLRKSISRTISHLVMLMLTMGMVAAMAQNTVPPTARQAAADPAFAARLARQVPAHPATKSQALIRPRRASPQDQILYDNGPYNGTTDAWTINFGFSTSESFTGGGPVTGLHFVYWDASSTDLLTTVDISVGSTSFGGTPQTLTGVTNTFLGTNQFGYNLYQADYSFSGIGSGSYVTLSNACTTSGCSVSNPIYWDENSGAGCTSQGCPSTAYENTLGSIPSESFSLDGGCTFDCPPQCVSDAPQDSFKIIHNFTGNEHSPASGLATDRAGKLYGTTGSGGDNGLGLAYRLALSGQDWIFSPLYSFLGGINGQNPLPEIVGPEGELYGAADGGIQSCGSSGNQYCGVIYRLRLSPAACRTALCSWTEEVIYQFTGDPDGWSPGGKLVPDRAGNLYGTTRNGGVYGGGTVFELTPSAGGWTEKIIYSFTGGSDGGQPDSLLLGQDGNLYGTTYYGGDGGGGGVIFQLVPSGDSWTETVIASYGLSGDGSYPMPLLLQQSSGNLYGLDYYDLYFCDYIYCYWDGFARIFLMSPSGDGWQFSVLDDTRDYYGYLGIGDWGADFFADVAIDAAGNLYGTEGGSVYPGFQWGKVFKLPQPHVEQRLVGFAGADFQDVEVGPSGKLYGTTGTCGSSEGTVWQLTPPTPQPKFRVLHDFTGGADGAYPQDGLSMDAAGDVYGTTYYGGGSSNCSLGCGGVFKLSKLGSQWVFAPLHSFTGAPSGDGAYPDGRLTLGPDGALYGTTVKGGTVTGQCYQGDAGCGTVFSLKPPMRGVLNGMSSWTETVLYQFQGGSDGIIPFGQIVFDPVGNIYGATYSGGSSGFGTVYELVPSGPGWAKSLVYTFSGGWDGGYPSAGLVFDQSGNLYGTTEFGGNLGCFSPNGCGAVFQLVPSASGWTENRLYAFGGNDGYEPNGDLILDASGNVYGRTYGSYVGYSIVYMLHQSGQDWTYRRLYELPPPFSQAQGLTMDAAGNLYGAACQGGVYQHGYVFELQPGGSGWTFTSLHDFQGSDGDCPMTTVLIGSNGSLYGTAGSGGAYNNGVVWGIVH